jgi:hypothetical protein
MDIGDLNEDVLKFSNSDKVPTRIADVFVGGNGIDVYVYFLLANPILKTFKIAGCFALDESTASDLGQLLLEQCGAEFEDENGTEEVVDIEEEGDDDD